MVPWGLTQSSWPSYRTQNIFAIISCTAGFMQACERSFCNCSRCHFPLHNMKSFIYLLCNLSFTLKGHISDSTHSMPHKLPRFFSPLPSWSHCRRTLLRCLAVPLYYSDHSQVATLSFCPLWYFFTLSVSQQLGVWNLELLSLGDNFQVQTFPCGETVGISKSTHLKAELTVFPQACSSFYATSVHFSGNQAWNLLSFIWQDLV